MNFVKMLVVLLGLLMLPKWLLGQERGTQVVRGVVMDAQSDYPLTGATVQWVSENGDGEEVVSVSDVDGRFELQNVPIGRRTFVCRYVGYKDRVLSDVLIVQGKETVLTIRLEELVSALDEVVVESRQKGEAINEMAAVSVNTLEADEVMRFSGTFGDVSRMAQNYAGVTGADDSRNDLVVRGNSPSNLLWRMDGLDVPSPNHWASLGSTGGPVSMLNTNNLSTSDFLTGAFPAEYGNVTAAVMDINLRNGNTEEFEFLGQVGFNGFEFGAEGPLGIGKNASFLGNFRYSALQLVSSLGIDFGTGSSIPNYQDFNAKIDIPTQRIGRFSLWGIGGKSDVTFLDNGEEGLYTSGDSKLESTAGTAMFGLTHQYFFSDRTSSRLSFGWSSTTTNTLFSNRDTLNTEQYVDDVGISSLQDKFSINWTVNSKLNAQNLIRVGFNVDRYKLDVLDSAWVAEQQMYFFERDYKGTNSLYRGFAQWEHKFSDYVKINAGMNAIQFDLNDSHSLEPRVAITFGMPDEQSVSFAFGRHGQMQPLTIYFNHRPNATPQENAQNMELDFFKSNHFVASFTNHFAKRRKLKVEAYYQQLFDVAVDPKNPSFSILNAGGEFNMPNNVGLVNEGFGRNYGTEITFHQNLYHGFYFMTTSSLFQSKYQGFDQVERDTYYNTNFVFNLLGGKEWLLNDKLSLTLDGRFTYSKGRRYTPIDLQASIEKGSSVLFDAEAFSNQYPDYLKPDIKFGLRRNGKKTTHSFAVDLQNFINRQNVFVEYYNVSNQEISTLYQRGFFPDVRYQILF